MPHRLTVYGNNLRSQLFQYRNAAPKENLSDLLKESSVRERRHKKLKDVFVKAQEF